MSPFVEPREDDAAVSTQDVGGPCSPSLARSTNLAAEEVGDELKAIADAEDRYAEGEDFGRDDAGSALGVDAGGAAREHQRLRRLAVDFLQGQLVGWISQ